MRRIDHSDETIVYEVTLSADEKPATVRQQLLRRQLADVETPRSHHRASISG
jgi:hypothetical protein